MDKPKIETILSNDLPLRGRGNELHCWCPFCSSKKDSKSDRFVVWKDKQTFWCRQCKASGDVIEYVQLRDNCDFKTACRTLGITLDGQPSARVRPLPLGYERRRARQDNRLSEKRQIAFDSDSWQKSAREYVETAQFNLWFDDSGASGRDYLISRGITSPELWTYFGLGYMSEYKSDWGGKFVKLPRGIVLPCEYAKLSVFKVNVRNMDEGKRYIQASGSANVLFNGRRLSDRTPAVLVEGELDAMSISQAVGDPRLVTPVATSSASAGRIIDAVAKLAQCPKVFLAFDNDKSGNDTSEWWQSILDNAVRLRPIRHDVNEMLINDGEQAVRKWLGV